MAGYGDSNQSGWCVFKQISQELRLLMQACAHVLIPHTHTHTHRNMNTQVQFPGCSHERTLQWEGNCSVVIRGFDTLIITVLHMLHTSG